MKELIECIKAIFTTWQTLVIIGAIIFLIFGTIIMGIFTFTFSKIMGNSKEAINDKNIMNPYYYY